MPVAVIRLPGNCASLAPFVTPLLAGNVARQVTADNGKQGRRRAVALPPDLSKEGQQGQRCLFHDSIIDNFMIYQDRIEINILLVSLIIFEVNIVVEQ